MDSNIQFLMEMYAKMFAASSPIAAMAMAISMTPFCNPQERWQITRKACHVSLGILLACALFGSHLLDLFGLEMNAFKIAGGIVMGMMGFDLLKCDFSKADGSNNQSSLKDIIVTPLAFPIISGPGAISSLIITKSEACNQVQSCLAYVAVALIMATFYFLFYLTSVGSKWLTPAFIQITSKLCGLIVLAMSAQFFAYGILGFLGK